MLVCGLDAWPNRGHNARGSPLAVADCIVHRLALKLPQLSPHHRVEVLHLWGHVLEQTIAALAPRQDRARCRQPSGLVCATFRPFCRSSVCPAALRPRCTLGTYIVNTSGIGGPLRDCNTRDADNARGNEQRLAGETRAVCPQILLLPCLGHMERKGSVSGGAAVCELQPAREEADEQEETWSKGCWTTAIVLRSWTASPSRGCHRVEQSCGTRAGFIAQERNEARRRKRSW